MEDCSAVFDVDMDHTKQCAFTECHECHRGFCITCQTSWHPGNYQRMALHININNVIGKIKVYDDKEALKKTLKRAKINNWSRCPRCGQIVEREVFINKSISL